MIGKARMRGKSANIVTTMKSVTATDNNINRTYERRLNTIIPFSF